MTDTPTTLPDTRERLLDTSERLFAERGVQGASLRAITEAAGVNLAAVHYHFGSKDGLAKAVFLRRLRPINDERLRRLDQLEADARPGAPALEQVVEAFVSPVLRLLADPSGGGRLFAQLMGRALSTPDLSIHRDVVEEIRPVLERFLGALSRCLPELPRAELLWRVYFSVGSMAQTVSCVALLRDVTGGLCDPTDVDGTVRRLVAFLAAGLRAPVEVAASSATAGGRTP